MDGLQGNLLIAHGGGLTQVINNSLKGVVEEAKKHKEIVSIYGAKYGVEGILSDDLIDLGLLPEKQISLLTQTPASALGSCRRKLDEKDYPNIMKCFKKYNIRYFFYNGGNDSMDTCNKISSLAALFDYDVRMIGIPKTIDNDLTGTDHCPGYGSAAKYAAISALELSFDAAALPIHVVVLELMGRNAGWLAAASAIYHKKMPCEFLLYLPEMEFAKEKFLSDVTNAFAKNRGLLVAVSEGIKNKDGKPIGSTGIVDGFGHMISGGAAQTLADMINKETSLKSRAEKPGLLGRTSICHQSIIDRKEAYLAGSYAVKSAIEGKSGFMVSIKAERVPAYSSSMDLVPLDTVANTEKLFPPKWINDTHNGISEEFIQYCKPLIDEYEPEYARFY